MMFSKCKYFYVEWQFLVMMFGVDGLKNNQVVDITNMNFQSYK